MRYGIKSTFMQMYAFLIDYFNEICKEDERNIIWSFLEATEKFMLDVACVHIQKRKKSEESYCGAFLQRANSCWFRSSLMPIGG